MPDSAHIERTTRQGRRTPRGKRAATKGCVRSCAACRARAPRDALLRFALVDGRVVFDLDKRLGGRGLSLGPSPGCLALAHKRGVFQRQWKIGLSPEDVAVLVAQVRQRLGERLHHWITDGVARGALTPTTLAALEPVARPLWDDVRLSEVVGQVPPVAARTPRAARKLAVLAHAVSQFTFQGTGDKKRRPEPADVCSALAPDTGIARVAAAESADGTNPPSGLSNDGGRERRAHAGARVVETRAAVNAPAASDVSSRPALSAGEGLVPLRGHPSGGSE